MIKGPPRLRLRRAWRIVKKPSGVVTMVLPNPSILQRTLALDQNQFFHKMPRWLGSCLLPLMTYQTMHAQNTDFSTAVLTPFWKAQPMQESLFFIQATEHKRPSSRLLFQPTKILSVTSATLAHKYLADRDYIIDLERSIITLPASSQIPFKTTEEMYPLMTADLPKIARQAGDKLRGIFFDNQDGYHQLQVEVTYECAPNAWQGPIPKYAGESLPHLMAKLTSKQPVKIFLSGDSISEGYNASKFSQAAPYAPAYGELFAQAIQKQFGSQVTFKNFAVGGWQSSQGIAQAKEQKLSQEKPDLVIIAYGMNDVFKKDAASYQANIGQLIDIFRTHSPNTEFLLVATMLGNAEWGMPMEQFYLYRDALKRLTGPGIVLADLTEIWQELLKRKSFYDLTGNGVNHPNDCGHRIYAQVLMARITPTKLP